MSSILQDPPRVVAHLLHASSAIPNHPSRPLLSNLKRGAAAVACVALPRSDPVFGVGGPLLVYWK